MTTVSACSLRKLTPTDKSVVAPLLVREWGGVEVVALSLGGVVDASTLPGWLAESDGEVVGLLRYLVRGDVAELVTVNAFTGGGVGSALLGALVAECQTKRVRRIRVTTTNDNTPALRFYQRGGFRLTALRVRRGRRRVEAQTPDPVTRRGRHPHPRRDRARQGTAVTGDHDSAHESPRGTGVTSASARAEVLGSPSPSSRRYER